MKPGLSEFHTLEGEKSGRNVFSVDIHWIPHLFSGGWLNSMKAVGKLKSSEMEKKLTIRNEDTFLTCEQDNNKSKKRKEKQVSKISRKRRLK